MTQTVPALNLRGISRRFGATLALDGVDFTLAPGEIHALLGENGAGKSTLMKIVRGLLAPTAGTLEVAGEARAFASPQEAARAGIGMVHQHFLLVPVFTVAENLALAANDQSLLWNPAEVARRAQETMDRLGWQIPLQTRISDLPVGTQQRVEILKALLGEARILLFDEPTAVLSPPEIESLFTVLRGLRAEGRSLVFVSHKLQEVMDLCDRVTVLRRGKNAGMTPIAETNTRDLARRMVGAEASAMIQEQAPPLPRTDEQAASTAAPRLVVQGLATTPQPYTVTLRDIAFEIAPGEIFGVAGVDGNGQTELAQTLTGLRPWSAGTVRLNGRLLRRLRPQELVQQGIAVVPPDRHREGLALALNVSDNLVLESAFLPRFRRGPFLQRRALRQFAEDLARDFDVRAPRLDMPAAQLSGGNQQKIVIARALWRKPSLLIVVNPTRGLDVAATAYVHARLRERQREGGAILLISMELDEVVALSTRVAVLYEGRIAGIVPPETPRETLGLMMGGQQAAYA